MKSPAEKPKDMADGEMVHCLAFKLFLTYSVSHHNAIIDKIRPGNRNNKR